jgi:hypothetical protein
MAAIVPVERIEKSIYLIRGKKIILDSDLASIYGIPTYRFNEAVKRNKKRFPEDFMFQLKREEVDILISQNAMSKPGRGGRRSLPYVFTEHGAVMAANILKSPIAVEMSVIVVRAFVKMREIMIEQKDLARKLSALEKKYDKQFQVVFDAIRALMAEEEKPRKKIGFEVKEPKAKYTKKKHQVKERS